MQISLIEVCKLPQSLPITNFQESGIAADEIALSKLLKCTVDMNGGNRRRIRQVPLSDVQPERLPIFGQSYGVQTNELLAKKMGQPFRRAPSAHVCQPTLEDGALRERVTPKGETEVRIGVDQRTERLEMNTDYLATAQRAHAVVGDIGYRAEEIDNAAWQQECNNLTFSISKHAIAAGYTLCQRMYEQDPAALADDLLPAAHKYRRIQLVKQRVFFLVIQRPKA